MHSMTVQCALICRYLQKTFEKATTQIGDPIMEKGGIKKELHLTAGNLPLVVMDMTLSSVFVIIDLSKDETEGFL